MFRSSVQRFGRFLLDFAGADSEAAPQHRQSRSFDQRARQTMAKRRSEASKIVAGSVQLIGMDEIRESLGEAAWEAVATKSERIAERTIRRHLSSEDAFERHQGDRYVVCFATASKSEAERRTKQIVDEIKSALIEEVPEGQGLQVDHVVAELDWAEIDEGESLLDALAGSLRKVRDEANEAAKSWRRALLREASVLYGPVRHGVDNAIILYRCLLDDGTGKLTLQRLRNLSNAQEVCEVLADLDCLVLSRGVEGLHNVLQSGTTAELLIPINYQTMHDKVHREAYVKLCRDMPDSYRRFLAFELHSIPLGAPISRVTELAQMLKPHGNAVVADATGLSTLRATQLGGSGLFAMSMAAGSLSGSPSEIASQFGRFAMRAKAAHLKTMVHGADTIGLVEAAARAGINYISGKAIALPQEMPKPGLR